MEFKPNKSRGTTPRTAYQRMSIRQGGETAKCLVVVKTPLYGETRTERVLFLEEIRVISIIDDDESIRSAVRSLLRSHGYSVLTFSSAEDFLQSPQLDETSCLISDVQMPGMSGIELQLALVAQGKRIPMIFITAFPHETVKARAIVNGAVCFLAKPFETRKLLECIGAALDVT